MTISFGHAIDALTMCVGEIKEVSGVVSTQVERWLVSDTDSYVDVTSPDNVLVSGRLASGAVLSAHAASQPAFGSGQRLEIYGREGTLVVENDSRLLGGKAGDASLDELPIPDRLTWVPEDVPQGPPLNVAQMYRRLGEAIRSGEKATPDFDDAVALHKAHRRHKEGFRPGSAPRPGLAALRLTSVLSVSKGTNGVRMARSYGSTGSPRAGKGVVSQPVLALPTRIRNAAFRSPAASLPPYLQFQ